MFIIEKEPKSIAAESYRTLRTNIQYSSFDKQYKTIVVTSSEPGEGKSTITGNLALSLAQGEKKVLIIDCDLRKPSIYKKFKISHVIGLSDVIIGKEDLHTAVNKYNKNLSILASGKIPPNPSEMLSSKAMTTLLERLEEIYDYIILDAPPVQAVTDAQILSAKADGTILVIKAGETKKDSIHNTIGLLRKVKANIIGTILNAVDNSKNKYYYYYGEDKQS